VIDTQTNIVAKQTRELYDRAKAELGEDDLLTRFIKVATMAIGLAEDHVNFRNAKIPFDLSELFNESRPS